MRSILLLMGICFTSKINSVNIHVFGDSHSCEFSQTAFYENFGNVPRNPSEVPKSQIHYLGPVTMHRIGRDGFYIKGYGIEDGDIVIFAFGEIDVRCHINKHADQLGTPVNELIDILASDYVRAVLENTILYNNIICMIYSVTPPTGSIFNHIEYPWYGPLEDRVNTTKKLNTKLAELCEEYGLLFIDIYNEYANPDGSLNLELSDGSVHINPRHNKLIWNKVEQLLKTKYYDQPALKKLFQEGGS